MAAHDDETVKHAVHNDPGGVPIVGEIEARLPEVPSSFNDLIRLQ